MPHFYSLANVGRPREQPQSVVGENHYEMRIIFTLENRNIYVGDNGCGRSKNPLPWYYHLMQSIDWLCCTFYGYSREATVALEIWKLSGRKRWRGDFIQAVYWSTIKFNSHWNIKLSFVVSSSQVRALVCYENNPQFNNKSQFRLELFLYKQFVGVSLSNHFESPRWTLRNK